MNRSKSFSASLYLALATFFWSGNFIAGSLLGDDLGAVALNFWRWVLALAVMSLLWGGILRRELPLIMSAWKHLSVLGLTGVAMFHICVYKAVAIGSATNAVMMLAVVPAVIALVSRCIDHQRLGINQWFGILLSITGALILVTHGNWHSLNLFESASGEVWMLIAIPVWAVYSIVVKRKPAELSQEGMLIGLTAWGILFMVPVILFVPNSYGSIDWSPNVIAGLGYVSLFASVVAFSFWNRGVSQLGPSRAGVYINLMPLFGTLLAVLILGEALTVWHFIGAALVIPGILFTQTPRVDRLRLQPARPR